MRIKKLQEILRKKGIDAAIFYNSSENKRDKSIFYYSGIDPEFCFLLVPKNGKPVLTLGKLEEELARKNSKIKNIIAIEKKFSDFLSTLKSKYNVVGINYNLFSLNEKKFFKKHLKTKKFMDISKDIISHRIEKDEKEIEMIKKACTITDNIFKGIITSFNFKNEKEIEMFISDFARKNGCSLSFPPIVASCANSSMPHYKNNDMNLKKGFLLIDFGINCKGYCSDITRTVYLGNPGDEEILEYYRLLGVQEEAIRKLCAGTSFKKIDEGVRKVLGKSFIHSLGHGLGIDVHEPLSLDKNLKLKEGTVLTVEPGVYYPGKYGIRIEDDVLITKQGHVVLTNSPKDLIIIGL